MSSQYPYPNPNPGYPPQPPSNGMGTAALILGIIGLLLAFIPIVGLLSWILTPLAILFGIIGLSKSGAPKGTAMAGLITGVLGLLVCIAWAALFSVALSQANASNWNVRYNNNGSFAPPTPIPTVGGGPNFPPPFNPGGSTPDPTATPPDVTSTPGVPPPDPSAPPEGNPPSDTSGPPPPGH